MTIQRDALLRVVKAIRLSVKLNEDTKALLVDETMETVAGTISGLLCDALFYMMEERLEPTQDFWRDSITMRLIRSELDDETVTDYILSRSELPKPITMDLNESKELYETYGGYQYEIPEGEWPT